MNEIDPVRPSVAWPIAIAGVAIAMAVHISQRYLIILASSFREYDQRKAILLALVLLAGVMLVNPCRRQLKEWTRR